MFRRCWLVLSLGILFSAAVFAQATGPRFFDEISKLERKKTQGELDEISKQKLAELYFLTSRCHDLAQLFEGPALQHCTLCCACGEGCSEKTPNQTVAKLSRFRALLLAGQAQWGSKELQPLWMELKQRPEAKYLALRFLHARASRLNKTELALQHTLEEELGLLELGER